MRLEVEMISHVGFDIDSSTVEIIAVDEPLLCRWCPDRFILVGFYIQSRLDGGIAGKVDMGLVGKIAKSKLGN